MREFDRIDRICELLKTIWKSTPDWRLGQLMVNYFGRDPFYIEDSEVEKVLTKFINDEGK